jgi:hypothetical protein
LNPFSAERLAEYRRNYAPLSAERSHTLAAEYVLASAGKYQVFYSPLGDARPEAGVRLILVGLTPGERQVREAARLYLESSAEVRADSLLWSLLARERAAFAGTMRKNLCCMLDELGLARKLGLGQSSELFSSDCSLAFTTSALAYPVFEGPACKNFSGGSVSLSEVELFRTMLETLLSPTLSAVPNALVIPLGQAASSGLHHLCQTERLDRRRVLFGFPHPSGANGHRRRQFEENRQDLALRVSEWFGS